MNNIEHVCAIVLCNNYLIKHVRIIFIHKKLGSRSIWINKYYIYFIYVWFLWFILWAHHVSIIKYYIFKHLFGVKYTTKFFLKAFHKILKREDWIIFQSPKYFVVYCSAFSCCSLEVKAVGWNKLAYMSFGKYSNRGLCNSFIIIHLSLNWWLWFKKQAYGLPQFFALINSYFNHQF